MSFSVPKPGRAMTKLFSLPFGTPLILATGLKRKNGLTGLPAFSITPLASYNIPDKLRCLIPGDRPAFVHHLYHLLTMPVVYRPSIHLVFLILSVGYFSWEPWPVIYV